MDIPLSNRATTYAWQRPTRRAQKGIAVLLTGALIPGCLLNSVHPIASAAHSKPDHAHAIVVIGIGIDAPWPYPVLQLTFPEYSLAKQRITGNCFHYNRIELSRAAIAAPVRYFAFEVPANAYAYVDPGNLPLAASSMGHAFIAPPGGTVYFGDYVLVDNKTMEFRRDFNAARIAAKGFLPRGALLEPAETTGAPGAHMPLCTP